MKQTPKQFFATPAGKLTLAVIAMVLCWTILIVYLSTSSPGGTWFPTEAHMDRVREDIKKYNKEYETEQAELIKYEELQDKYEDSLTTFWNADRDGQPEIELRNLVSGAAERAEANIQTLGSVRISNINNELSYADLDFTVVDEYSKVVKFFAEIEKCTPRLSWRRVEVRVEPTRTRAVTGPGNRPNATTTATTTPAQMFRTNGQVRVVKYSPAGNSTSKAGTASKTGTTAAKTGTTATAARTTTATTTTTTPAAATATPAAKQDDAAPAADPAAATATPAQTEPAATATTNKESEK